MNIIVAGAGQVGKRVAEELANRNHDVMVIDIDEEVCEKLSVSMNARVINGDASDIEILKKAEIEKADVCIGLIGDDSPNLAFTVLASAFDVTNILVRMRDSTYKDAYLKAGANRALNTTEIYMDSLIMEIEYPSVETVARLGSGEVSIVIVEIPEGSPAEKKRIAEIIMLEDFPTNCVFAGIYREKEFIIPRGNQKIKANDKVFLSGDSESIRQVAEFLGLK